MTHVKLKKAGKKEEKKEKNEKEEKMEERNKINLKQIINKLDENLWKEFFMNVRAIWVR